MGTISSTFVMSWSFLYYPAPEQESRLGPLAIGNSARDQSPHRDAGAVRGVSWLAFPTIVLALAIVSVLGTGIYQVTIAVGLVGLVGLVGTPRIARVARAATLGVMAQPYLEASVSMGARPRASS